MHLRTLPYDVADRLPTSKASTAIWINNCISPSFVSASVQNLLLRRQVQGPFSSYESAEAAARAWGAAEDAGSVR